jgi:hypothetical protein
MSSSLLPGQVIQGSEDVDEDTEAIKREEESSDEEENDNPGGSALFEVMKRQWEKNNHY